MRMEVSRSFPKGTLVQSGAQLWEVFSGLALATPGFCLWEGESISATHVPLLLGPSSTLTTRAIRFLLVSPAGTAGKCTVHWKENS